MTRIIVICLFLFGCATTPDPRDRVVSDFTSAFPKNYLVVHEGNAADFGKARCYVVMDARDEDSRLNVKAYLHELLAERLPMLHECGDSEWPRLQLMYTAGYGTCIDCDSTKMDPRSAFAFIALADKPDHPEASAEWQYWRGGNVKLVIEQFVFDFANLYINGLEKPVPRSTP